MSEVCGDNRFKLIGEFKGKLVDGTNIETSPEEMAVLDNILFRIWQMGWLDKLKAQEPMNAIVVLNRADMTGGWWYQCPICKMEIEPIDRYCKSCGQAVKWE